MISAVLLVGVAGGAHLVCDDKKAAGHPRGPLSGWCGGAGLAWAIVDPSSMGLLRICHVAANESLGPSS